MTTVPDGRALRRAHDGHNHHLKENTMTAPITAEYTGHDLHERVAGFAATAADNLKQAVHLIEDCGLDPKRIAILPLDVTVDIADTACRLAELSAYLRANGGAFRAPHE